MTCVQEPTCRITGHPGWGSFQPFTHVPLKFCNGTLSHAMTKSIYIFSFSPFMTDLQAFDTKQCLQYWKHPASCPACSWGPLGLQLTTHPHLLSRLRMHGAINPLLHMPLWHVSEAQGLYHLLNTPSISDNSVLNSRISNGIWKGYTKTTIKAYNFW